MTGADLKAEAIRLYGERGWQPKLATALGVNVSTVKRWISGDVPVSERTAIAIRSLQPQS